MTSRTTARTLARQRPASRPPCVSARCGIAAVPSCDLRRRPLRGRSAADVVLARSRDNCAGPWARTATGRAAHAGGSSREVENALRRLQTDWIDLYQVHRPRADTDIEETLSALGDLVHQAKVRYIRHS